MWVEAKDEMIKELRKRKSQKEVFGDKEKPESLKAKETFREEEWEFQFAWDRHATFMNAQSVFPTRLSRQLKK